MLLHAPGGYGKSVLLGQWRKELGARQHFLARPDARALAMALAPAPEFLLLDEPDEGARQLVDALPPEAATTLIIATRDARGLRLARRRAMGRLLEIGAPELAFDESEAALVLGQACPPPELARLMAVSQGWPLAVALHARSSGQGRAALPDGENHVLFRYFTEEVMEGLPDDTRDFLLRIAMPGRICAGLCDALAGAGSQARLDALQDAGLFLQPLDEHRRWYRLQPLFLAYLRRRLHDESPLLARQVAQRATAWFHAQGLDLEAGQHALRSGNTRRAYGLLQQVCRDASEGTHNIADLITPAALRRLMGFPDLVLGICWVLCNRWQFRLVNELLAMLDQRVAEMHASPAGRPDAVRLARLIRHRRMMQALFEDAPALAAEHATRLLPEAALLHPYVRASIHSTLLHAESEQFRLSGILARDLAARRECDQTDRIQAQVWHGSIAGAARLAAGETEEAARTLQESMALARQEAELPWLEAIPAALLAELHLERDETQAAQALLDSTLPQLRQGMVEHLVAGFGTAAQLHWLAGRGEEALATLAEAQGRIGGADLPRLRHAGLALRLQWLGQQDAAGQALALAREHGISIDDAPPLPGRGASRATTPASS